MVSGQLNDRLVRSLLTLNFVRGAHVNALPELGRFHTGPGPTGWEYGVRLRARYQNEALVISCGEIDARDVIRRLPLDARIVLPVPVPSIPPHEPAGEPITFDELAADIEADYLAPFYRGMRILRDIGLKSLFLLAVPPPGIDDDAFEAHTGFQSHAHVRYAVHRTINLLFERFCAAENIAFVDSWALVAGPDGILQKRFVADGIHLNRDAAVEIVAAIGERLVLPPAEPLDPLL
jgi:hypothetical protein